MLTFFTAPLFLAAEVWYVNYENALKMMEKKQWLRAIQLLNLALKEKNLPKLNAKTTGLSYIHYLPYYHLGVAFYNSGDYKSALHHFNVSSGYGAIKEVPELYGGMKKLQEICNEKLQPMAQDNAALIRKYITMGDEYLENNRYTEAKEQYIRARQLLESVGGQRETLEDVQQKLRNALRREMVEQGLEKSNELYRTQRLTEAKAALEEVLRQDPGNQEAKRFLDVVHAAEREKTSGDQKAEDSPKPSAPPESRVQPPLSPGSGESLTNSVRNGLLEPLIQDGKRLFAEKKFEEARQKFAGVIQVQPGHTEAAAWLQKLAAAQLQQGIEHALTVYFSGRAEESEQQFSELAAQIQNAKHLTPEVENEATIIVRRFLAVIVIEKHFLGLDEGSGWKTKAAGHIRELEKRRPGFRLERDFFSPKVVDTFEMIQRNGEK